MYLEYFGFQDEPFNITPNSRFLFLSKRHREALASLLYGIEQRKGFIALTGNIGCGKTTICRALIGQLDKEKFHLALVFNPELNDVEILQLINAELGVNHESESKRVLLGWLNDFLLEEYEADRIVVLVIDEAQRLTPEALEQIRLLSNLETETSKLIQIALVGQPELGDMLDLPELEQLNQRITVRYHIEPLNFEEVADYIDHRLSVAEPERPVKFTKKAIRKIFDYSGGVPRRINVVSDRALLVTYVKEEREVTEENVVRAIEELGGMPKRRGKRKDAPGKPARAATADADEDDESAEAKAATAPRKGGAGLWPVGLSLLLGLAAIAYAISTLNQGPGGNPPAIVAPRPTPVATPAPLPTVAAVRPNPTPTLVPPRTPAFTQPPPEPTMIPTPEPSPSVAEGVLPPEIAFVPPPPSPPDPATSATLAQPTPTIPAREAPPAPSPEVVEEASPAVAPTATPENPSLLAQMLVPPTPTPKPDLPWTYDASGVMRVTDPAVGYPASVLTWIALKRGERLGDGELAQLRAMTTDQIAALQLTQGRAPLFLREARFPATLSNLGADSLPVLVQVDNNATEFGPWAVLVSTDANTVVLHDPRKGRVTIVAETLEDHLTAIMAPYFDPDGITGLRPLDSGTRVLALQQCLRNAGLYLVEPTGLYDPFTESLVQQFRKLRELPGTGEIDALTALRLLAAGEVP